MWQKYRKTAIQEMRNYVAGEDLTGVSVAPGETPKEGGKIARDRQGSQWYVSPEFMAENYEVVPGDKDATRAMPDAVADVLAERCRQVRVEGFTADHDDQHYPGQLARAAACYALGASDAVDGPERATMDTFGSEGTPHRIHSIWPFFKKWHKPVSRRRDLVKAAAMLIAEIERIDRAGGRG